LGRITNWGKSQIEEHHKLGNITNWGTSQILEYHKLGHITNFGISQIGAHHNLGSITNLTFIHLRNISIVNVEYAQVISQVFYPKF